METIKVSIVLPFKNAALYFKECIESIRAQSHVDWELIAIDDHSTDQSRAIVEGFQDPRIVVHANEGEGILPALQSAQQYINGDVVTRMDADDSMPPHKLASLLALLESEPNGTVATGRVKYFSDSAITEGYQEYENWLNKAASENSFYNQIYRECVVASPNWMMRRADFEAMEGFRQLQYPEDYDMVFHWRRKGYLIKSCSECTHLWREHSERTSRNSDVYQQESFFRLKLAYFLEEFQGRELYLIGTEQKGVLLTKMLQQENISFRWFAQDPQLIGKKRREVELENINSLPQNGICILSIYPKNKAREELVEFIHSRRYVIGETAHFF